METEDLLSIAQRRNPVDLTPLPCCWREALPTLAEAVADGHMPPRTELVTMAERLAPHLAAIVAEPRRRLMRGREQLRLHELRMMDSHCLRWYARQPGQTPVEKAGRKGRLMGVVREQVVDLLENRVAMAVVRSLEGRSMLYLDCYGKLHPGHRNVHIVHELVRIMRGFLAHPELGSLPSHVGAVTPNNALLRDVHYRMIWKAYSDLRREDERARTVWDLLPVTGDEVLGLSLWGLLAMASKGGALDGDGTVVEAEQGRRSRLAPQSWPSSVVARSEGSVIEFAVGVPTSAVNATAGSLPRLAFEQAVERDEVVLLARRQGSVVELPTGATSEDGSPTLPRAALAGQLASLQQQLALLDLSPVSWSREAPAAVTVCELGGIWSASGDGSLRPVAAAGNAGGCLLEEGGRFGVPRLADALWEDLLHGDKEPAMAAAVAMVGSAFCGSGNRYSKNKVLVVPDGLDFRALSLLQRAMLGSWHKWLLPHSVAVALYCQEHGLLPSPAAEGGAPRVSVLSLGGPWLEMVTLELHPEPSGKGLEWWHSFRPERSVPLSAGDALVGGLRELLDQEGLEECLFQLPFLLGSRNLLRCLSEAADQQVEVAVGGVWRDLPVPVKLLATRMDRYAEDVAAEIDSFFGEVTSKRRPETVIVTGWPLCHAPLAEYLASCIRQYGAMPVMADSPTAASRGGAIFLERLEKGQPSYLEILPDISIVTTSADGLKRTATPIIRDRKLRPGEPLRETQGGFVLPAGKLDFRIPILCGSDPREHVARWQDETVHIERNIDLNIDVIWVAGCGGLRLELEPVRASTRVGRVVLTWDGIEALGSGTRQAENIHPPTATRVECPAEIVAGLESELAALIQELTGGGDLNRVAASMSKIRGLLPGHRLIARFEHDSLKRWQRQVECLNSLMGWLLDVRFKNSWQRPNTLNNKLRDRLAAASKVYQEAIRITGCLAEDAAPQLIEKVSRTIGEIKFDGRKGRRRTGENQATFLDWFHAAGRLICDGKGKHAELRDELLSEHAHGCFVDDPSLAVRQGFCWAVGTALFTNHELAGQLLPPEVDQLTVTLQEIGAGLLENRDRSDAWKELGIALLGLLRVRAGNEETRGPASEWSRELMRRIPHWQQAAPEQGTRIEFRNACGDRIDRSTWLVLEDYLRGDKSGYIANCNIS